MGNLQSAFGIFALLALAWIVSEDRRGVAWGQAAVALLVTFATAVILLKVPGATPRRSSLTIQARASRAKMPNADWRFPIAPLRQARLESAGEVKSACGVILTKTRVANPVARR